MVSGGVHLAPCGAWTAPLGVYLGSLDLPQTLFVPRRAMKVAFSQLKVVIYENAGEYSPQLFQIIGGSIHNHLNLSNVFCSRHSGLVLAGLILAALYWSSSKCGT